MYRGPVVALAAAVALGAAGLPAAGQAPGGSGSVAPTAALAPDEAELVRRIEELVPKARAAWRRASLNQRLRDSLRRAATPAVEAVELSVGPLRVVTPAGQEGRARRLISSELERLGPATDAAADVFGGFTLAFQYAPTIVRLEAPPPAGRVAKRSFWPESTVRRRIRTVLGARVTSATPPIVRFWLGDRPLLTANDPTLHRTFVLEGSRATTACRQGDVQGCWAALGLSGARAPVAEWYSDEQVRRLRWDRGLADWVGCREGAGTPKESCDETLLASPRSWTAAIPLGHALRTDLVAFALELGGPGALDRFLGRWPAEAAEFGAGTGPRAAPAEMTLDELGPEMRRHLAAASGLPADELMRRWRERVMAAEPAGRFDFDRARLATGFWLLFFAALATRSTRWRLG